MNLQFEIDRASRPELALAALLALVLAAAVVAPYFLSHSSTVNGRKEYALIATHDLSNHFLYMENFEKSIGEGDLYPRWFGEANLGYGIAIMNYYPPGFYYLTTLLDAIFRNWHTTLFAAMILALGASGWALYFLARTFFGRIASGSAAVLYMLLPYHLVDLYFRGALPEFLGFALAPMILYYAYRVGRTGGGWNYAGLGLFFGLHILVQLPVSILLSYTLAFYAIVWAILSKDYRILLRIGGGMALGLAISSIYWLPAALEAHLVFEWASEIFLYHSWYINPRPSPDPFELGIVRSLKLDLLLLGISALVYRLTRRPAERPQAEMTELSASTDMQIKLWMIVGAGTLFMTNALSYDVGRWLPKLELAVPPFRWLALAAVFCALLAGAIVERLLHAEFVPITKRRIVWLALGTVVALNLLATLFGVIPAALGNPNFQPALQYVESSMTPASTTHPEALPDTARVMIEPQGGAGEVVSWKSQSREVRVNVEQPSRVRLKTYNFPGWTAWVDGKRTPVGSDSDGIQVVEVPAGTHTIDVRFLNTWPRWAGTILTWLGILTVCGLALAPRLRAPRRISAAATPETPASAPAAINPRTARLTRYGIVAALAVAAVVVVISVVIHINNGKTSGTEISEGPGKQPGVPQAGRRGGIMVGAESVLSIEGQSSVSVAKDERALADLLGALAARENGKIDEMISSQRIMRVPENTSVTVLEIQPGRAKVRLREGENAMKEGWVVDRWIR